jgi:hypothetical protein
MWKRGTVGKEEQGLRERGTVGRRGFRKENLHVGKREGMELWERGTERKRDCGKKRL